MPEKEPTLRQKAYASGKEITSRIIALGGRCQEQVIDDEFHIFFERWLFPNGVGVVALYGPDYREAFVQVAPKTNSWTDTDAALKAASEL